MLKRKVFNGMNPFFAFILRRGSFAVAGCGGGRGR